MQSNTLKTIQTLAKIGKIVSKILYICSIVGFCFCIVGIVSLALGAPTFKLGGVTLETFLFDKAGKTAGTLYAAMIAGAVFCACECVLAGCTVRYLDRELADGTPFTRSGAKALQKVGILTVCLPIAAQIAAQIAQTILSKVMPGVEPLDPEGTSSVSVGVMMILTALVFRYGAELNEAKQAQTEASENTPEA